MFVGKVALASLIGITVIDIMIVLFYKEPIKVERDLSERLNLADENFVKLTVRNQTVQPIHYTLIEGYPNELQERSEAFSGLITAGSSKEHKYHFVPKQRGAFTFGNPFVIIRSMFFLASRRIECALEETVQVYPSVLQMKKYELLVFQQQKMDAGIKRIRRLGNNSEFEQIKSYVQGDDIKHINWKATSRRNELMINQYQEEKSQSIYCIIDKSRSMQMEAHGLTMLDYAINTSLVFSNIALRKGDKAGLITYSDKLGTVLPADGNRGQIRRINEHLFNQKTEFREANYELLYQTIRKKITTRSLLVLFTNFETEFSMRRAMPYLRRLNKKHLLVVVNFENGDLQKIAFQPLASVKEVYQSVIAEKMLSQKSNIARELQQNGIQTVLTLPEDLSISAINKYLELKAKGAI